MECLADRCKARAAACVAVSKAEKDMEALGKWRTVNIQQDRITMPWGESISFEEMAKIREYRRAHHLVQDQADLFEHLMMERDFYKENCHRQARFGLMLNDLFKPI